MTNSTWKEKSTKELYHLAIGQVPCDQEDVAAAKQELISRRLNLDDTHRINGRIELETLLDEQKCDRDDSFFHPSSMAMYYQLVAGIFAVVVVAVMLLVEKSNSNRPILYVALAVSLMLVGYKYYRFTEKKKTEKLRHDRIRDLMKEL